MDNREKEQIYQQTLDYLFKQLPMFQRVGPKAFRKDLKNMTAFAAILGNPEKKFPSVHIAGTNGKGSTAHLMAGVLQAHGLKTGLYTSPHYRDFRERIKINGQLIPQEVVVDFVNDYKSVVSAIRPSFFEWSVGLAFHYFAAEEVDVAVIETGLGGRLDSTNIIDPMISVITNISFDHMEFLGDTLPKIASEKAGIIKKGVPVVIGEWNQETRPVFEQTARNQEAPLYYAPDFLQTTFLKESGRKSIYQIVKDKQVYLKDLEVDLQGNFQVKNLTCALSSLLVLSDNLDIFSLKEEKLRNALLNLRQATHFIGRWQWLEENPRVLCDSAHNEGGVKEMIAHLDTLTYKHLHIVLGMVGDKDMRKVLSLFPREARYYFARPSIPRGMAVEVLQEMAAGFGLTGTAFGSVADALQAAKNEAGADDLIFVGGSTFVVAEVV